MLVIQTLYDIGLYPRRIAEMFGMTPSNVRHLLTADNSAVAKYVSDVLSDEDQADGFIFNRFYADCARNGVGIPWEDVL